jgi:hypothetical protein
MNYIEKIRVWSHAQDHTLDGAVTTMLLAPETHVPRGAGDAEAYAEGRAYLCALLARDEAQLRALMDRHVRPAAHWENGTWPALRLPSAAPLVIAGKTFKLEQLDYTRELLRAYLRMIDRYEGLVKLLDSQHPHEVGTDPATALRRLREERGQVEGALDVVGSLNVSHMVWIGEVHSHMARLHSTLPHDIPAVDVRELLLDSLVWIELNKAIGG